MPVTTWRELSGRGEHQADRNDRKMVIPPVLMPSRHKQYLDTQSVCVYINRFIRM